MTDLNKIYEKYKNAFDIKNCKLLTTYDEFAIMRKDNKTTFRINMDPKYSSIPWYKQYLFDYNNLDKNNIYKTLGV